MALVREKFTAYLFGAGGQMDAYRAASQLPDTIAYFLVGGAASITFITMLNRYRERGEEAEGERVMSVIISVMLVVLGVALLAAELLAGWFVRWYFAGILAGEGRAGDAHDAHSASGATYVFHRWGAERRAARAKAVCVPGTRAVDLCARHHLRRIAFASLFGSFLAGCGRDGGRLSSAPSY